MGTVVERISTLTCSSLINLTSSQSPFPQSSSNNSLNLPSNSSDPIKSLLSATSTSTNSLPTVLLSSCSLPLITSLLPCLPSIINKPILLQLSTSNDHSDLLTLRSSGIPILYSSTPTQAQANSLLAAKFSKLTQSLVLHYFDLDQQNDDLLEQVTDKDVQDWIHSEESDLQYEVS